MSAVSARAAADQPGGAADPGRTGMRLGRFAAVFAVFAVFAVAAAPPARERPAG